MCEQSVVMKCLLSVFWSVQLKTTTLFNNIFVAVFKSFVSEQQRYTQEWDLIKQFFSEFKKEYEIEDRFENIFRNGKVELIMGDLNMPMVKYLAKLYFPKVHLYDRVPMAVYVDYQLH